ncbi:unnamed protein product [Urochloa humidicola]
MIRQIYETAMPTEILQHCSCGCKKSTGGSASILTVLPEDFFQRVDSVSVICDDPEVAASVSRFLCWVVNCCCVGTLFLWQLKYVVHVSHVMEI